MVSSKLIKSGVAKKQNLANSSLKITCFSYRLIFHGWLAPMPGISSAQVQCPASKGISRRI